MTSNLVLSNEMCYKNGMRHYLAWALLAALLAVTVTRNEVWRDEGSTWVDIIQKSPRKARAYNELVAAWSGIEQASADAGIIGSQAQLDI